MQKINLEAVLSCIASGGWVRSTNIIRLKFRLADDSKIISPNHTYFFSGETLEYPSIKRRKTFALMQTPLVLDSNGGEI